MNHRDAISLYSDDRNNDIMFATHAIFISSILDEGSSNGSFALL